MAPTYRILFICWGNICRSPTVEGIVRRDLLAAGLDDRVTVDSAGTSAEHLGRPPDKRALTEARRQGLDLSALRARRVTAADWDDFDLLLVADESVDRSLRRQAPTGADLTKIRRITDFVSPTGPFASAHTTGEVPDPYYGGAKGFRSVFALLEEASTNIITLAHSQLTKVEDPR
jgi:protein-tyrosine phosphatase